MTPKLGLLKQVGCSCILTLRTMFRFWRYSNRHVRTWLPTLTFPVFVYTYLLIVFTVLLVCLWLCSSLVQEQRNCRQNANMYTGTPCLLCFAILRFVVCVCYKLKTCGHPVISHFISATFPTAFAHFLSLCPILVILAIFQAFLLVLYLLQWSMISELWYTTKFIAMTHRKIRWWLAFFDIFFLNWGMYVAFLGIMLLCM